MPIKKNNFFNKKYRIIHYTLAFLIIRSAEYIFDYFFGDRNGKISHPIISPVLKVIYTLSIILITLSFIDFIYLRMKNKYRSKFSPNKKKETLLGLIILVTTTIIGLSIGEVVLRMQGEHPVQEGFNYDSELGWVPDYTYLLPVNEKLDRVLFIGDSFTQPPNGYVKSYENSHNDSCINKIQAITLGVAGYGTAQAYLMLKKHISYYKPKVVVLGFFVWNDLADNLNDIYYSSSINNNRPAFEVNGDSLTQVKTPSRWKYFLLNYFAIARAIWEYYINSNTEYLKPYTAFQNQYKDFYTKNDTPRSKKAWGIAKKFVSLIRDESEKNNAKFLLIAFNNAFSVEKTVFDEENKRCKGELSEIDPDKPLKIITQFSLEKKLDFINITDVFKKDKEIHPTDTLYHQNLSGHFTGLAENIVGDTIHSYLKSRNFIKCN